MNAMQTVAQRILSTFDQLERPSLDLHTLFEFVGGNAPSEREAVLDAVADLVKQGLLTPDAGSDFYRRTEEGRLALASPRDVTMYMREGCHLCEEAKAQIAPLLKEFGARLTEINIDEDPAIRAEYDYDIPVIFLGARKAAKHRVDLAQFRRQLHDVSRPGF